MEIKYVFHVRLVKRVLRLAIDNVVLAKLVKPVLVVLAQRIFVRRAQKVPIKLVSPLVRVASVPKVNRARRLEILPKHLAKIVLVELTLPMTAILRVPNAVQVNPVQQPLGTMPNLLALIMRIIWGRVLFWEQLLRSSSRLVVYLML